MTIDTSGNVGIGTIAPQKALDVVNGIRLRQSTSNNSAALIEFSNRNAAWGQGFSWNAYYDGTWKRRTADYPALYSFSSTGNMSYLTAGTGSADSAITWTCLLYTSPSPRDRTRSRMPSSA